MTQLPAPQGVKLLKELLFDRETKRLDDLGRRIEADAEASAKRQQVIDSKIDAIFERAGSSERLQHSVAGIIDGALREAEVDRHDPLARAIAPLVVHTIKVQLRESQDEMVEALYPITGRLVQSYVQAAMNEMMVKINAKLGGGGAARLVAQSSATGVSAGELALAEANPLTVEELFLLRRRSGELVAHWERSDDAPGAIRARAGGNNRDQLISGYISGIMSLSEEAFGAKPGSFRTLALENGDRIFVRGAAAHLLAVRCSGGGAASVEQVIDEVFIETIEKYQQVLAADGAQPRGQSGALSRKTEQEVQGLLPEVGRSIETLTAERRAVLADAQIKDAAEMAAGGPNFTRLYVMAGLFATPFIIWGLWSAFQSIETARAEAAVRRVLASTDDIRGVPPRVEVERGGRALTISGFVPTGLLREQLLSRLAQEVPQAKVRDQLGVLPAGSGPAEVAIAELRRLVEQERRRADGAALARPIERAQLRLGQLKSDIARAIPRTDAAERPALDAIAQTLDEAAQQVARSKVALDDGVRGPQGLLEPLKAAWLKLRLAESQFGALLGGVAATGTDGSLPAAPLQIDLLSEDVATTTERLSAAQLGLAQALALRSAPQRLERVGSELAVLSDKVDRMRPPTARESFETFARSTAVFFDNGAEPRDSRQTFAIVDRLVREMRALPDVVLRVVGYTDERGGQTVNSGLAQTRADRIAAMLSERGISGNRVVAVGRLGGKDLSRSTGVGSANRRVEFEIGFPGETGGSP
jgi:outer membrane protein OmpA-like peptidoglycan-associated protein